MIPEAESAGPFEWTAAAPELDSAPRTDSDLMEAGQVEEGDVQPGASPAQDEPFGRGDGEDLSRDRVESEDESMSGPEAEDEP